MANDNATAVLGELESLTRDPKATQDYSQEATDLIPKAQTIAKAGRVQEAVDELLVLEKKARQASDALTASKLTCAVLSIFKDAGDWKSVNEYVVLLPKKRGQLKRAIVDMVQLCMGWLDDTPDQDSKLTLINTLSNVTEGKILVEVERARLTRILAKIKEDEGNVEEAANLLQEVQVETFGGMEKREKAEYILDQMRLVMLKLDYVRCQIISRKINTKLLDTDDFQDIKLRYYQYMVQCHLQEQKLLDTCKAYFSMLHTKKVQEDQDQWMPTLQCYTLYLLLAPFDNEQTDMLNKLLELEKKKLSRMPIFMRLVKEFTTLELMQWPLDYEAELKRHSVFTNPPYSGGEDSWKLLRKRVIQHNVKVIGTYYSRIRMDRMSSLLRISNEETEIEVSELVCSKFLTAKIDRPAGVVRFGERKNTSDCLNDWSGDIGRLLDLVEESSHLIQKEKMVHAARAKRMQMKLAC